jgi:hypothetical protein
MKGRLRQELLSREEAAAVVKLFRAERTERERESGQKERPRGVNVCPLLYMPICVLCGASSWAGHRKIGAIASCLTFGASVACRARHNGTMDKVKYRPIN